MTDRFFVLGGELSKAEHKTPFFCQIFKYIESDLGLKTAFAAVERTAMNKTVEVTGDSVLLSAVADLAMGETFSSMSRLAKGSLASSKLLGSLTSSKLRLARFGIGHGVNF